MLSKRDIEEVEKTGDWEPSNNLKTVILYVMFAIFIIGMIVVQIRKG
jgi:hypothetical protein